MEGREVTFEIDKRREPVLLSEEQTLANTIIAGLFLVPGQSPANPDAGVNIRKYLYKTTEEIDATQVRNDLVIACGDQLVSTSIKDLAISSGLIDGVQCMIIQIDLIVNGKSKVMALAMQQLSNERVHLNYKFVDRVVG